MCCVFSCLSFIVLLIALLENVVQATSFRSPNSTCVWTERQLRSVIEKASNLTRTRITLCRRTITISKTNDYYNVTEIDLTDRFIYLRCYLKPSEGKCTLDGKGSSRIFYGERTDLTVRNVKFMNAKPDDCFDGGAVFVSHSKLTFTGCSFMSNANSCDGEIVNGGAIAVSYSTLTINGGSKSRPVLFSDNQGSNGGAVFAERSEVTIDGYTIFFNNAGNLGGAVSLFQSTANIKNINFQENTSTYASALYSFITRLTMKNVDFIRNDGSGAVINFFSSSLQATNCTFSYHNSTVLKVSMSKITLKNSTFSNNTFDGVGSNIYIVDDKDPSSGGTFVNCESKVVFCKGLHENSIYESLISDGFNNFSNTNCNTTGLKGTPGKGSCPNL